MPPRRSQRLIEEALASHEQHIKREKEYQRDLQASRSKLAELTQRRQQESKHLETKFQGQCNSYRISKQKGAEVDQTKKLQNAVVKSKSEIIQQVQAQQKREQVPKETKPAAPSNPFATFSSALPVSAAIPIAEIQQKKPAVFAAPLPQPTAALPEPSLAPFAGGPTTKLPLVQIIATEWQTYGDLLAKFKRDIADKIAATPELKKFTFMHIKRQITPKFGQIVNSQSSIDIKVRDIDNVLKKALSVQQSMYLWSLNYIAKAAVSQAETEASATLSVSYALAHVIINLTLLHPQLHGYIMARLRKKCIYAMPSYGLSKR